LVGAVLFAASAGVSWYLTKPTEPDPEEVAALDETDPSSAFPNPIDDKEKTELMPVAMRPETPVTVEAVTKLAQSIMQKEEKLFDKQTFLQKEEERIGLLFEDLKREQEELMAFEQKISAKIMEAREAAEILKQENLSLTEQTKVLSTLEKKTGKTTDDVANDEITIRVDAVKGWFEKLEAEQAANYLKEFANRGDLEFAAKLLDSLEKRQISKILAVFDDAPLVAQIIDAYTKHKVEKGEPTAKTSRLSRFKTR
jgi:hypothetical protein